jgi:aspartyl-tRNA synthetase
VFLAADAENVVVRVLGALRPHLAARFGLIDATSDAMVFVVDFPLFSWNDDERRWEAEHHMFTAPRREDEALLATDPGAVLSESYDFVVNGHEVASGSLRIHRADLQQRVFDTVGFSADDAEARFGSSCAHSGTARRHTGASRRGWTGRSCCCAARTTSATSSPSRRSRGASTP